METKEEAYTNAKISKLDIDWKRAHKLRNIVNQRCKNAKDTYTKENIENNKFNPKKFWLNLNSLWGSSSSPTDRQTETLLIDPATKEKCSKEKTSTVFNKFFSEIAVTIQDNIPAITHNETISLARATNSSPFLTLLSF